MPDPEPKPNDFPATVTAFRCQNRQRCNRVFPHIHVVQIGKLRKILIDGCPVEHIKFQCPHCGGWNYHNQNEADIEEQNRMLLELLGVFHGQKVVTENESAIITTDNSTG